MELNKEQTISALKFAVEANEKIAKEFNVPETVTVQIMRAALSIIIKQDEQIKKLDVMVRDLQSSLMPN